MSRTYSLKDVAEHSSADSPWFIIRDKVYNVTKLLSEVLLSVKLFVYLCCRFISVSIRFYLPMVPVSCSAQHTA